MDGTSWTITGNKQSGTFVVIGQECIKVNVEMPVSGGEQFAGVDFYLPSSALIGQARTDAGGSEAVFTVRAGTTVFRSVLQPILLGQSIGPTAIPSSAPAGVAWGMVSTLALPAS